MKACPSVQSIDLVKCHLASVVILFVWVQLIL